MEGGVIAFGNILAFGESASDFVKMTCNFAFFFLDEFVN